MADMETTSPARANHSRQAFLLAALAGGLLAAGTAVWLWLQHGLAVYLAQAATFAWNCF
jgi:hypothetical protein